MTGLRSGRGKYLADMRIVSEIFRCDMAEVVQQPHRAALSVDERLDVTRSLDARADGMIHSRARSIGSERGRYEIP